MTPEKRHENYLANKEKQREQSRRWAQEHPERARELKRKSAEKNRERDRERKRERYQANKAILQERNREYYQANRDKLRAAARSYQSANRAAVLARHMRRYHGSGWEAAFAAFWEAQGGRCYLCGDELDRDAYRGVHIDHDHSCCPLGRTCAICRRGLACPKCNSIIGFADDDPDRLRRIADGLEAANAAVRDRMACAPRQAALL
jgi:hypothetical protein